MKEKWSIRPFGEVCKIIGGSQPPKDDFIYEPKEGFVRLIQVRDYKTDKYKTFIPKEKAKRFCSATDLMIGRYGPPIFGIFRGLEGAYNVALMKAIPDHAILDLDYFYWFLKTDNLVRFVEKTAKRAAGQDGVRIERLNGYPVPIPPLPEQKRIVAILDEAFSGIARAKEIAEKNLANAREIFESYLESVFTNPVDGWEFKTLAQVATDFGRGKSKHRPRNDPKLYNGKYPFIQTGEVRNSNHLITEFTQTYNEAGLSQSKLWPKGTLCITIAANIAETGVLNFDSCFPDSVIGLVANNKIADVHFVEYLLQSYKAVLKTKGKGSAQDNINLSTFENEKFPFPSITVQKDLVKKLNSLAEQTKKLESIYQQKLASLEELKKSILQKAFRGE